MISIRRARPADAAAIGAVHVAAWRSAYPGILPDSYLSRLSVPRQAAHYDGAIRGGGGVYVATASGNDVPGGSGSRVVGFATAGRARAGRLRPPIAARMPPELGMQPSLQGTGVQGLGEGEIETLYVLDDWRERGLGRRLIRAAAAHLAASGCRSAFLWVLRDNNSRWFYQRLGGKPVAEAAIHVGGAPVAQVAFVWDPIEKLLAASPAA